MGCALIGVALSAVPFIVVPSLFNSSQLIFLVFSTRHLLRNIARQKDLQLGEMVVMDCTGRVIRTQQPVGFLGVVDILQAGHLASGGIWSSENKVQADRHMKVTYRFANILRDEDGDPPLAFPLWGVADNSDAFQSAIEGMDAEAINCKVHVSRNAQQSPGIVQTEDKSRKEIVKEVRVDLARLATNTYYSGLSVKNGPIATTLTELFIEKWDRPGTSEYAATFKKEYTGTRKGNHQQAHTNPGLPVHNNAIERKNLEFKEEGTRPPSAARARVLLSVVSLNSTARRLPFLLYCRDPPQATQPGRWRCWHRQVLAGLPSHYLADGRGF
jgi:hypothetical protein